LENFAHQIKHLVCVDIDSETLEIAKTRINEVRDRISAKPFIHFVNDNYKNIRSILLSGLQGSGSAFKDEKKDTKADVIILDLGVSTFQLKNPKRGFGFDCEIEDMRYNRSSGQSARELIINSSIEQLNDILSAYAGIKRPQKISVILKNYVYEISKLKASGKAPNLAQYLEQRLPKVRGRLHPATLVFQALRIAVNNELANLESFLKTVPDVLNLEGLLFIITYHSIEDKIVKTYFKNLVKAGEFFLYNKKVIKPTYQEIRENRSIRSAKLRILYRK
jgi:16S rRNA (cytosine1402-N4)-methyltransferase